MRISFWLILIIVNPFPVFFGNNQINAQSPKNPVGVSLEQDLAGNLAGGLKTGAAYAGLINLDFNMSTEAMNLWENGSFRVHIQNTYGQKPSEKLVGDIQVFSSRHNNALVSLLRVKWQY